MERSDLPDDDAPDDGAYPTAPIPLHERAWRHPSEIGAATWVHSEPPLTLGRGLMIATGAIGGLLSLALLWVMLPSAGRGGVASPTVVSSTSNDSSGRFGSHAETFVATSLPRLTTATESSALVVSSPPPVQAATTMVPVESTAASTPDVDESAPIAVRVGDSMFITTAHAVEGRSSVTVRGANGYRHGVHVLLVDRDLGLAVLGPEAASLAESFTVGAAPSPGDAVTVLGGTTSQANVTVDANGQLTLDGWNDDMPEGAPVVNANGELIAICSHAAEGPVLVSVANLASLLAAANTASGATPGPWLAVHVVDSGAGPAVDGVDPNGPAAAGGVVVGDTITAVNGKAVGTVDDLKSQIASYAPGATITLTVLRADQTSTDLTVTLGTAPSM